MPYQSIWPAGCDRLACWWVRASYTIHQCKQPCRWAWCASQTIESNSMMFRVPCRNRHRAAMPSFIWVPIVPNLWLSLGNLALYWKQPKKRSPTCCSRWAIWALGVARRINHSVASDGHETKNQPGTRREPGWFCRWAGDYPHNASISSIAQAAQGSHSGHFR